jgi:hypothetical protein
LREEEGDQKDLDISLFSIGRCGNVSALKSRRGVYVSRKQLNLRLEIIAICTVDEECPT